MSIRAPLLTALVLLALPLRANDAWQVTTWTTDNVLPQGVVYAVHQTRDGYLWFTTLGGLVRYDGVEFTSFAKAVTPGLRSSRFTALCETSDGALWAGTEDGFVSVYRRGAFTTFSVDGSLSSVMALRADGARPWAITQRGVYVFDGTRFVRDRASDPTLGFLYRTGGAAINGGRVTIQEPGRPTRVLEHDGLLAATADDDSLWTIDSRGNAFRYRGGQEARVDGPALLDVIRSERGRIGAMTQTRDGAFWISSSTRGLARIAGEEVEWITPADGLASLEVWRLYEDREGTLWAASAGGGISEIRRRAARTFGAADGLVPPNVYPILARKGELLAGSWGGGLYRFDGRRFEHTEPAKGPILSLAEDADGALWVSTHGGGVDRIRDGEIRHFGAADGLPSPITRVIYRTRDGRLWFGTNAGLAVQSGERFITYRAAAAELNFIQTIAEERDGALLLGTRGGVARFRDGRFSVVANERSGLSSDSVRALHVDDDGTIWAGTYDGGLDRIRHGKVAAITTRQGLFDNGVFAIIEEGGFFWMSSNRGIHRASRRELNAVADGQTSAVSALALTRGDGMLSPECNGGVQPAAARTADGRLWFPTQQGMVAVDPRLVRTSTAAPPVALTSVSVDGEDVSPATAVRIAPDSKRVELRFAAPTSAGARLIRYRYKLEGFDNRWNDLVGERVATYTHLPPGRYRFAVIASNADGRWSAQPATTQLVVLPPFWQTWWFMAIAAAAAAALLWTIVRLRVRAVEREQAAQAEFAHRLMVQQEEERKRVAAELHDSIGQSLLIIKNRALLGLDDKATGEQLAEISDTASSAIDEVRRIAHNLRPVELDHLGLTGSVDALLRRMSSSSPILFSGDLQPVDRLLSKEAEVNVFRIVQEWLSNVARHSAATAAVVSLQRDNGTLRLRIRDDGTGFTRARATSEQRLGIGLRSIAERVQMLGGTYDIRSMPGEGTSMTVEVPLKEQA